MVLTAARAVVPEEAGNAVCRLVLVVAAEATTARFKSARIADGMMCYLGEQRWSPDCSQGIAKRRDHHLYKSQASSKACPKLYSLGLQTLFGMILRCTSLETCLMLIELCDHAALARPLAERMHE